MIENWIILAIFAGLASNIYNFLNRYMLKDGGDATLYGWFVEGIRLFIALAILTVDYSFTGGANTIFLLLLLGFIELCSVYVFMKMHEHSHLSLSTIISRGRLILVPILAFFLLHETFHGLEYLGIGIIFFGLSTAVAPKQLLIDTGVKYAYLSVIIVSLMAIVMKLLAPLVSTSLLLVAMSGVAFLLLPFIIKNPRNRLKHIFGSNIKLKLFAAVMNTISMYLYTQALITGPVGQVLAIYQAMMIVSVIGGIFILNERQDARKKILGTIITLAGVAVLSIA